MSENTKTESPEQEKSNSARSAGYLVCRRMLLASLGVMNLAQEEVDAFIDRMVARGEIAEKEGKKLMEEMRARRQKRREHFQEEMSKRMAEALKRTELPTKADIEALNQKIASLNKKLDELKKAQS